MILKVMVTVQRSFVVVTNAVMTVNDSWLAVTFSTATQKPDFPDN